MRKKQLKILIGAVIIVAIILTIVVSVGSDNMTYYYEPSEILADTGSFTNQKIRVMGLVQTGTVQWIPKDTKLTFEIADKPSAKILVEYQGSKPDMFREGQGVVLEGVLDDNGRFIASSLFVKHTEEYQVTEHSDKKSDYLDTLEL